MKIIYVDKITSIGENIFAFISKGKVIMEPPFVCKKKTQKNGSSVYHFDKEDLEKIHEDYPEVFEFRSGIGLSRNDYIVRMKDIFEQIIRNGDFVRLLSSINGTSIENTEIRWSSDILVWINIDIPLKTCTVHSEPYCIYVEQKKESPFKGIETLRRDGGWLKFENMEDVTRFCINQYPQYKRIDHC